MAVEWIPLDTRLSLRELWSMLAMAEQPTSLKQHLVIPSVPSSESFKETLERERPGARTHVYRAGDVLSIPLDDGYVKVSISEQVNNG